ncbi:MAG: TrgA family protein [Pseudomonadota bacterium]
MTGGRLAAGFFMGLAMLGAMVTYLDEAGFEKIEWPPALLAAAIIGFVTGWSQLGGALGRDFMESGAFGVGAAIIGLVFFAMLYGMRSAYITHTTVQFNQAIDVIAHILDVGIKVISAIIASKKTMAAFVVGALITGILSEYFHRIWR